MIHGIAKIIWNHFCQFMLMQDSRSVEFAKRSTRVVPKLKMIQENFSLTQFKFSNAHTSELLAEKINLSIIQTT